MMNMLTMTETTSRSDLVAKDFAGLLTRPMVVRPMIAEILGGLVVVILVAFLVGPVNLVSGIRLPAPDDDLWYDTTREWSHPSGVMTTNSDYPILEQLYVPGVGKLNGLRARRYATLVRMRQAQRMIDGLTVSARDHQVQALLDSDRKS